MKYRYIMITIHNKIKGDNTYVDMNKQHRFCFGLDVHVACDHVNNFYKKQRKETNLNALLFNDEIKVYNDYDS